MTATPVAAPPKVKMTSVIASPKQTTWLCPPLVYATIGASLIVTIRVSETAGQPPEGSSVVRVSSTVPNTLAAGVYSTRAGLTVCDVLFKEPVFAAVPVPPVMDQAPVVAVPPTEAPESATPTGDDDSQTSRSVPTVIVAG